MYATFHPGSVVTVALDNMSAGRPLSLLLRIPGYSSASREVLRAPALSAKRAITLGDGSFTAAGVLNARATRVARVSGAFHVTMAPWSAAVLTIRR